jgi:DNA-binding transcriptional LysR family regulator
VSQPAVTREIGNWKIGLDWHCLIGCRVVSGITDAATILLRYAEQIFTLADAAEWELKELAGLSAGRLTVGASATLGEYFCLDWLHAFTRRILRLRSIWSG